VPYQVACCHGSHTPLCLLDPHHPQGLMDTPPNSPDMGPDDQGPTGGGGEWLPALASGGAAARQAALDWGEAPLPEGDPCRGHALQCRLGLRVEGGDGSGGHALPPGGGEGEGGGLGPCQDPGRGGPLLGDRLWSDAQVRDLWTLKAVDQGVWDDMQDTQPFWY